jgi:hypothetical protein
VRKGVRRENTWVDYNEHLRLKVAYSTVKVESDEEIFSRHTYTHIWMLNANLRAMRTQRLERAYTSSKKKWT